MSVTITTLSAHIASICEYDIGPKALLPKTPVQFPRSSEADAAIIAISGWSSPFLTAAHQPP